MSVDHGSTCPATDHRSMGFNSLNLYQRFTQTFGVLTGSGVHGNVAGTSFTESVGVQTERMCSKLDSIKEASEAIAQDLVLNFDEPSPKTAPNKFCKTMRRVVKDMLERHDFVFKGMVSKLNLEENNLFQTFVIVSDEIFSDGEVNWGRIVALYAFAVRLAMYQKDKAVPKFLESSTEETSQENLIAMFLGKYVASKLGQWMLTHGGWVRHVVISSVSCAKSILIILYSLLINSARMPPGAATIDPIRQYFITDQNTLLGICE